MSITLLLASRGECEGPKCAVRNYSTVRLTGMAQGDLIEIDLGEGQVLMGMSEDCDLPFPPSPHRKFISANHREASGNPVTVELL